MLRSSNLIHGDHTLISINVPLKPRAEHIALDSQINRVLLLSRPSKQHSPPLLAFGIDRIMSSEKPNYDYNPSVAGAVIAVITFTGLFGLHIWRLWQFRTWFCVPFVVGGLCTSDSPYSSIVPKFTQAQA